MFSCIDTISEYDRHTHDDGIYRASIASCSKNWLTQEFVATLDGGGIRGLDGCLTAEEGEQFCTAGGDEPRPCLMVSIPTLP